MVFDILVVARSLGDNSAGYVIRGLIENDDGATSFIGAPTVSTMGEDRPAWPSALYGEGLVRLRSDKIYARILAERETPGSKEAVLTLGRIVVQGASDSPTPALLRRLPGNLWPEWKQRLKMTAYFRSHLVLNSLYYLSQENIFDLDHETEAAITQYERESPQGLQRFRVLLVQYPDAEAARQALAHFRRVYLPERSSSSAETQGLVEVEDGWLGVKQGGRLAVFVFECPDRETAAAVIDQLK